jgi:catechol 2,3-dioxygenase-like lactoylglutathione lyase family enzyme
MTGDSAAAGPRAASVEIVREVVRTRDLTPLGPVLAPDVRWYGNGPGAGCRTRAEVLETLRAALARDGRLQLRDIRLTGDRAVLHVELPGEQDAASFVLTLDDGGLIVELQRYSGPAAVEHDLALLAGAGGDDGVTAAPPSAVNVHVADVERSVAFYRHLGFEPVDTHEPGGELLWAFLQVERASLMLARAGAPIDHREQAVLFYLYAHDLAGLRDHLVACGLAPGEIVDGSPGPRHEMRVADPDGYVLMIAQIDAET